jgi:DNA polymerase theta
LIELESLAEQCLAAASTTTTTSTNATIGNNSNMAPGIITRAINLNSTTEVAQALYVTLQLAPPPSAKAGADGKALSTKGEALDELSAAYPNCPFPSIVCEYRTITKLLSMCIEMLNFCTLPPPSGGGGNGGGAISNGAVSPEIIPRIHATVNQTTSVTGRLSMESPNLQTVPKPFAFFYSPTTTTTLSTTAAPYVCSLRKSIVAPPGMVLLSADYKQLELRMMAHLSGDVLLQAMLRDTTVDPFTQLAATWLGKPSIAAVTPEDRARAKNICYALLYGMGAGKLAPELWLRGPTAEQDAENLKKSFLDTFPGLQRWIQQVKIAITSKSNNAHSGAVVAGVGNNEIRTLFGRLRRFPNTMNQPGGGGSIKNLGNTALNSMTQGSAADISKLGMLAVAHVIEKLNTNSDGVGGGDGGNSNKNKMIARLVLSIHDEFLLEADARYVHQVAIELRSAMEGVFSGLLVPLPVKISIGRTSWGEMEELIL